MPSDADNCNGKSQVEQHGSNPEEEENNGFHKILSDVLLPPFLIVPAKGKGRTATETAFCGKF